MKVLVTGATGFVGSNLVRRLLENGDSVRAILRRPLAGTLLEGLPVETVPGDVLDPEALSAACRGIEGVYHLAAKSTYWPLKRAEMFKTNVEGTRNVLEAARRQGARKVVHASSTDAVGYRSDDAPADEDTPWNWGPHDIGYATTKHLSELEALKAAGPGLEVTVVNPGLILGPRDVNWLGGRFLKMVAESSVISIWEGKVTTSDVDDVCAGLIAAMARGKSGRRYILGGEHKKFDELFRMIGETMRRPVRVRLLPHWLCSALAWGACQASRLTRQEPFLFPEYVTLTRYRSFYSCERAVRELGYPRTPLKRTLEKTYDWYVRNGYLK